MIKLVLTRDDPILRQRSLPVTDLEQVHDLITDLWDMLTNIQKLYEFTRGSGLGAPQIGELWRVSVVEFAGQRYDLINPKIISHSPEKVPMREGCLSFFDYRGVALRYPELTIEATDKTGQTYQITAEGDFASLLQHELDHLDGHLYDDNLAPGEKLFTVPNMPTIP